MILVSKPDSGNNDTTYTEQRTKKGGQCIFNPLPIPPNEFIHQAGDASAKYTQHATRWQVPHVRPSLE